MADGVNCLSLRAPARVRDRSIFMERIAYVSRATNVLPPSVLNQLVAEARRRNAAVQITGALVSASGLFFQIVEGQPEDLAALLARLNRDPRHRDLTILLREPVRERLFPDWSMEIVDFDSPQEGLLLPFRLLTESLGRMLSALERYTQPSLLRLVRQGIDPITLPVRQAERMVLFADIVGFATLCDQRPFAEVNAAVGAFMDICGQEVERGGGEVAKLIGDCVMAVFPLEMGSGGAHVALAIQRALQQLRDRSPPESALATLHSGIGLAGGTVIEGNIGSASKLDYTLMGQAVNRAARLEAMTRKVRRRILLDAQVASYTQGLPLKPTRPLQLKGFAQPVIAWSIDLPELRIPR